MKNKARSIFILYFTKINQFCPGTLWPPTFPSAPASVPPPGAPAAPATACTGAARAHAAVGSPSKHWGRGWCPFANAPLPGIQAGNCPKMPPGGPAVSARGTSLGQSHSEYIHAVRRAVCLSVCPSPDGKASPTRLLLGRSVLEARGADVGLVEGVRGVKHLWGRRWGRCQDGAEWFVGAQHRGEVLHLLRQLPDLPAQGRVLPLQVFTLLGRQKQGGSLSCRCEWGGPGVQCGTRLLCGGSVGAAPHQDTPQHHKLQPSLTHLLAGGAHQQDGSRRRRWPCWGWGPVPAPLSPAVSKMTSFRQILPRAAAGQTPLLQPAGCGRDAGGPGALPGPGLREVTGVCTRPGFLAPSHAHARRRPLPGPPGRGEGALNNRRL